MCWAPTAENGHSTWEGYWSPLRVNVLLARVLVIPSPACRVGVGTWAVACTRTEPGPPSSVFLTLSRVPAPGGTDVSMSYPDWCPSPGSKGGCCTGHWGGLSRAPECPCRWQTGWDDSDRQVPLGYMPSAAAFAQTRGGSHGTDRSWAVPPSVWDSCGQGQVDWVWGG